MYKKSLFKIALYMNFVKPMYYHKSDKKKMKQKLRKMSIYDRNESIITDKLSFVKSKREKNSKIKLPAFRQEDACL